MNKKMEKEETGQVFVNYVNAEILNRLFQFFSWYQMERIVFQLDELHHKLSRGEYVLKYDALAMSSIDVNEPEFRIEDLKLLGLQQLFNDISDTLNAGTIHQQSLLAVLVKNYIDVSQLSEQFRQESPDTALGNNTWESLPSAPNHESSAVASNEIASSVVHIKESLHPKYQSIYNDIVLIMETKLYALEIIDLMIKKYTGTNDFPHYDS
jgi:hypothetical protein